MQIMEKYKDDYAASLEKVRLERQNFVNDFIYLHLPFERDS